MNIDEKNDTPKDVSSATSKSVTDTGLEGPENDAYKEKILADLDEEFESLDLEGNLRMDFDDFEEDDEFDDF